MSRFEQNDKSSNQLLQDMQQLSKDMQQVDLHLTFQTIPEKVILLLGETKAGKTTLMYYLLGKKLIRQYNKQIGVYHMRPQAKIFDALIGNNFESTTVYPNIPTQTGDDKVLVIDMPGFNDTRFVYRFLNIYIIREVIKKIRSVHVSIVVSNEFFEANDLLEIINRNCQLLNSKLLNNSGYLSFILTKIVSQQDEISKFKESLEIIGDVSQVISGHIGVLMNAKIYTFENDNPRIQQGVRLKKRIIQQNKFLPINEIPQNLLSQKYADVISGQQNYQQFINFIVELSKGIHRLLILVIELFSEVVRLQYYYELTKILGVELRSEQEMRDNIINIVKGIQWNKMSLMQIQFNQQCDGGSQQQRLLNLIKIYYTNRNKQSGLILNEIQYFIFGANLLKIGESRISRELRISIYKIFIFCYNTIKTIDHIHINEINILKMDDSQQIREMINRYRQIIDKNNLIQIIASHQKQYLYNNQQFKNILLQVCPNYKFDDRQIIIQQVKVPIYNTIRNKKIANSLVDTMKLVNKKQQKIIQIPKIQIKQKTLESISTIKNMPVSSQHLQTILNAITSFRNDVLNSKQTYLTNRIHVEYGKVLIRKGGYMLKKLQLYEQSILLYLSIASFIEAQNVILSGLSFQELSQQFIRICLIPYYSQWNINFEMIQKLYNYLTLNIYDYDKLLKNQQEMINIIQNMHRYDLNMLPIIKQFQFGIINCLLKIDYKQQIIKLARKNQKLINNSKLINLKQQIQQLNIF